MTTPSAGAKTQQAMQRGAQKMLDFSARNRLLNIPKTSRHILRLASCRDIASLENKVAAGQTIPVAGLCEGVDPGEVKRRLNDILHDARSSMEELGQNTVFLALGELEWREAKAAKSYRAPILLLPVRLERRTAADGVKLVRLDEDTTLNATLVEFLRTNFGITLAELAELPLDESGVDVPKVLATVAAAVAGREGWLVHETAILGCFSFGKFAMWADLTARAADLAAHPLVKHLVERGGVYDDGVAVFPPSEIAAHIKPEELFCPMQCDSSQLAAVLYSALGKTFVLHGPPGTGKSQTITNIIAHNLAIGRRVLFVSEKKAALDVVKSRLDSIGLSPFCLELHSNKTEKGHFYAQLREALEVGVPPRSGNWHEVSSALERERAALARYVAALHKKYPCGLSAYDSFARRKPGAALPALSLAPGVEPFGKPCTQVSREEYLAMGEAIREAQRDFAAAEAQDIAALAPLCDMAWSPAVERRAAETLAELARAPKLLRPLLALIKARGVISPRAAYGANLAAALEHIKSLRAVMRCRASKAAAANLGGQAAAALAQKPDIAFEDAFAAQLLDEIMAVEPAIAAFSAPTQEKRLAEFKALDSKWRQLAKEAIVARLAEKLPLPQGAGTPQKRSRNTEIGLVRRECEKKTRQRAVRRMLAEAPTLIPALKPCFLMSPLSVAQYLDAGSAFFDLVVFDEASQIPVWDALGVIARARQLIVVGDPKQMPPTSFFQKGEAENEDEMSAEEVIEEDQESILDECLAAGVYSAHLDWHYRSRHESLIAFSNSHYYGGRLNTFPSAAESPRLGVKHVFVEGGVFARSSGAGKLLRTNEVEARALVDYVCKAALEGGKKRSMGIVTFSQSQQRLLRAMIEERCAADKALAAALPEEGEGAYFVKNLENVQGDEADVILFSVGYAPDETGRFTMNFGPLNLDGGERRLNVAITRAKEQVVVFTSIRSSQIDAGEGGRTKALGAVHLKDFLAYAENFSAGATPSAPSAPSAPTPARGAGAPPAADEGTLAAAEEFLRAQGYETERNVGRSSSPVALAVRSKTAPDRFIAGIETDGPAYAAALTEQDRDINRSGVLKGLGWNMYRLWSVDWALEPNAAKKRLADFLSKAEAAAEVAAAY